MAMEIEAGTWKFFTKRFHNVDGVSRAVKPPAFKPTPLHDLEPLLWMAIWTLDARYLDPKKIHPWQSDHFWKVFRDHDSKYVFSQQADVSDWLELAESDYPQLLHLEKPISDLAECIRDAHKMFQQDPTQLNRSSYADHQAPRQVLACLTKLHEALTERVVLHPDPLDDPIASADPAPSQPSIDVAVRKGVKRKQNTDSILPDDGQHKLQKLDL
jgi:hypothetical protein